MSSYADRTLESVVIGADVFVVRDDYHQGKWTPMMEQRRIVEATLTKGTNDRGNIETVMRVTVAGTFSVFGHLVFDTEAEAQETFIEQCRQVGLLPKRGFEAIGDDEVA